MNNLQSYATALDALNSGDRRMRVWGITRQTGIKKETVRKLMDIGRARGEVLEEQEGSTVGYVLSDIGYDYLIHQERYNDFCKRLDLQAGLKNGNGLRMGVSAIRTLMTSPKGLSAARIWKENYEVHSDADGWTPCLEFLVGEGLIDSRDPKGEERQGRAKKIYLPKKEGTSFYFDWRDFYADYDVNRLEQELQTSNG